MVKATVFFTCDQLFGRALIHFNFFIVILICFLMMMPGVNFVIYCCSSMKTTPEVSLEENIAAVITQERVIYDNLKIQIKN